MSNSTATKQLVKRVCQLVHALDLGPVPRSDLARRWGVTPRSVNMTIVRARRVFGVRVRHVQDHGYVLVDSGILNRAAIARRRP